MEECTLVSRCLLKLLTVRLYGLLVDVASFAPNYCAVIVEFEWPNLLVNVDAPPRICTPSTIDVFSLLGVPPPPTWLYRASFDAVDGF